MVLLRMPSNEYRKTKKLLNRAKTLKEVSMIMEDMDSRWQKDNKIMLDNDWPLLVRVISKMTRKLRGNANV